MIEAVELGLDILSLAFNWLFSNLYTSVIIGISLLMLVIGIIISKVKG